MFEERQRQSVYFNVLVRRQDRLVLRDRWFAINDKILGSDDLPCSMPVLENGTTRLRVQAGIKNNGVGSTRIRYPFYQPYDTVIQVVPGNSIEVTPVYQYYSNLDFDISRNFESGNFLISHGSNEGITESTTNQDIVYEGTPFGRPLYTFDAADEPTRCEHSLGTYAYKL